MPRNRRSHGPPFSWRAFSSRSPCPLFAALPTRRELWQDTTSTSLAAGFAMFQPVHAEVMIDRTRGRWHPPELPPNQERSELFRKSSRGRGYYRIWSLLKGDGKVFWEARGSCLCSRSGVLGSGLSGSWIQGSGVPDARISQPQAHGLQVFASGVLRVRLLPLSSPQDQRSLTRLWLCHLRLASRCPVGDRRGVFCVTSVYHVRLHVIVDAVWCVYLKQYMRARVRPRLCAHVYLCACRRADRHAHRCASTRRPM